jgi:hypothetical protein
VDGCSCSTPAALQRLSVYLRVAESTLSSRLKTGPSNDSQWVYLNALQLSAFIVERHVSHKWARNMRIVNRLNLLASAAQALLVRRCSVARICVCFAVPRLRVSNLRVNTSRHSPSCSPIPPRIGRHSTSSCVSNRSCYDFQCFGMVLTLFARLLRESSLRVFHVAFPPQGSWSRSWCAA